MMRGEWTNTPYRSEGRGATLYGLPYDTSGRSLLAVFEEEDEAALDANSRYPLMIKFTKMVLEAVMSEKVKTRNVMRSYSRDSAEYWEQWCKLRTLIDIEEYYHDRLNHYRKPETYALPASLLA